MALLKVTVWHLTLKKTLRTDQHRYLIETLKQLRKDRQVTQTVLAERLGVPQSFVAKVEVGERGLDVVEFTNWLDALGCLDKSQCVIENIRKAYKK